MRQFAKRLLSNAALPVGVCLVVLLLCRMVADMLALNAPLGEMRVRLLFWISGFVVSIMVNMILNRKESQIAAALHSKVAHVSDGMKELRDLTDKLRSTEVQLEAFFQLSPVLLCIVNQAGYLVKVNPAWEKLLGYTAAEIQATPWINFVHPNDREATMKTQEVPISQRGHTNRGFINRYQTKDGGYRTIRWETSLYIDGLAYAMALDITDGESSAPNLVKKKSPPAKKTKSRSL